MNKKHASSELTTSALRKACAAAAPGADTAKPPKLGSPGGAAKSCARRDATFARPY